MSVELTDEELDAIPGIHWHSDQIHALEKMIEDYVQKGRRQALTELADKWQWGAWADVLDLKGLRMKAISAGQDVTDWLRRAALIEEERGTVTEGGGVKTCWCGSPVGMRPDKGFADCLANRMHDSGATPTAERPGFPETLWPECADHEEVQHRDGLPPWCNKCRFHRGAPARAPFEVSRNPRG